MEDKMPMINLPPKTLQRIESLKIYAILSGVKGEALEAVRDKLVLSLIVAYNDSEVIANAKKTIVALNRKPEEYQTPFMMTKGEVEKLIPGIDRYLPFYDLPGSEVEVTPGQISEYVAKVFETVGTAKQKEMATAVIEKYKRHVKFIPKDPFESYETG